ncbi:hypothetical protein G1H11_15320 [Phytoactinopolyspora alkaliphila]|uniref:Uncharacterized protein n=1 Tax=Phytoactinopolyspora alkaliphila TaxID=1783498 RepID=A0A6N9YPC9_9ACTN|nr:hypothetical protein [Phytoactinopolyspora alkaliphila]NED96679.1 hypothetical protein [Phytoactinopolyspora alkaliphila]
MDGSTGGLVEYGIDMVRRAPHLYAFTVAYWTLVVSTLVTRYGLRRIGTSERLMRLVVVLGCVSLILAFVDTALRGAELIQLSLVAYFATPIGIGRFLISKWDRRPVDKWRGLVLREITYVSAFVIFVALSAVDGDLWWFSRPGIDRSDPITMIESTNWFHLMASAFGVIAVIEAVSTAVGGGRSRTGSKDSAAARG